MVAQKCLLRIGWCYYQSLAPVFFQNNGIVVRSFEKCARRMGTFKSPVAQLKDIFLCGVEAVKPRSLFQQQLNGENDIQLSVSHETKRYHVIGFGKAVLGMAVQMEKLLGSRLRSGLISIPVGTRERFAADTEFSLRPNSVLEVIECARNNLPDDQATMAASRMKALARNMSSDDVLCVLVSGGGSALLCLPKEPVTLAEKLQIIKGLAGSGAAIDELNHVRIALSAVKGGQLALAAQNAFKVYSYVISDIVGDPVELIASGPTVIDTNTDVNEKAKAVLMNYNLWEKLPKSVAQIIEGPKTTKHAHIPGNLFLLGSNQVAVKSIVEQALSQGLKSVVLSKKIQGNVRTVSDTYVALAELVCSFRSDKLSEDAFKDKIEALFGGLAYDDLKPDEFVARIADSKKQRILIVGAGEPTVCVEGDGKGGRNQELALRFSYGVQARTDGDQSIYFLSAGTDGIDGPTDVAGAIGGAFVARAYDQLGRAEAGMSFVKRSDSYHFYRSVENGKYFVKTGHTGTNVMDIHLMLIT
uniref:Glycerate kinase n=2 Tax=Anopheles atroparvus TaxID=41427 RepID=A0AAG5DUZ5_ANOAO